MIVDSGVFDASLIEAFQRGRGKGVPRGRVLCKLGRREARGRGGEGAEFSVCA